MTSVQAFEPRWASAPGETVLAVLKSKHKTVEDLADILRLPDATARGIVTGATRITPNIAAGLATALGASPEFWLRRDQTYRDRLHWLSVDEVSADLPLRQMVDFGWIEPTESWKETAQACLSFFDVRDMSEWKALYAERLDGAHYRTSESFPADATALAAWIRQGERVAAQRSTQPWNGSGFATQVRELRSLTREADPQRFLPVLEEACSAQGVNVVVLRTPSKVPVSGVAQRNRDGRPMILLSARHLTDDHFWFTFFHEAAHVLLHDLSDAFVDTLDDQSLDADAREKEANNWAQDVLIPGGLELWRDQGGRAPQLREVVRFSAALNVAPGIVVGQLQHEGVLQFNQLNRLRRRYRWDGTTLRI